MVDQKKTIIIGASPNKERYAYKATALLASKGHEVVPVGVREGQIAGLDIVSGQPPVKEVHTVSLYIGPQRQEPYYEYILNLKPKRIIFNPGTENPELETKAKKQGVETVNNCTIIMLNINEY